MANWIQDPQSREEVDEVTQELKLPVYKPSAKGKFRQWFKESWNKLEDYLVNLKSEISEIRGSKEPNISKKSGFNLEKTNLTENDSSKLFTAKGALDLYNKLTSAIAEKEPKISKKSGFNLSKSDADDSDSSSTLATSKAVKKVKDALERLNLSWNNITGKPNFGLKSGEFMEGHRLAESLGVKEYGGLISSSGQKKEGNAYYDSNTKNMFYCKETNSYTSANSSYFEPFDNKELLNRLNNLQSFKAEIIYNNFNTGKESIAFDVKKYKFLVAIGKDYNWNYYSTGIIPILDKFPYDLALGSSISGSENDHFVIRLEENKISVTATRSYHKQIFTLIAYY